MENELAYTCHGRKLNSAKKINSWFTVWASPSKVKKRNGNKFDSARDIADCADHEF